MPGKSLATSLKAQAKGVSEIVWFNALRLRFRLVSPVPADSDGKLGDSDPRSTNGLAFDFRLWGGPSAG